MPVAIAKLSDALHSGPHFPLLLDLCVKHQAFLVGGAIRDGLIGRPITDLDLIFPEDPTVLAKEFAKQVGGHWFWLDKERRQSRVIVNHIGGCPDYDFALFRAPDLESDLMDRDFTVNALALPLTAGQKITDLIDPCSGLDDLLRSSLRMVTPAALQNDPLRIIKGVRHATVLDLEIEAETLSAMQGGITGLDQIARERIRQEFWKLFAAPQAARGLQLICESGVGKGLFGNEFVFSLETIVCRLKACRHSWQSLVNANPVVSDWLAEEAEQGLNNETLLLFTELLSQVNDKLPLFIAEKWLLSRKSRANISALVTVDKALLNEFTTIARNERAYAWWADRLRIDPKLLLLALAAIGDPAEILPWVPDASRFTHQRPNDLVDGHWLRNELHLNNGPEMSKAIKLLRNAEIAGEVDNAVEAQQFLVRQYQNRD